jgi:hypothetical protein
MEGEHYRSPCLYSPKCLEKLSEKPRRGLQRALRVAKEGAFWSISPSLHRPDSPSECSLCPFSDSFRRGVLGSSPKTAAPADSNWHHAHRWKGLARFS